MAAVGLLVPTVTSAVNIDWVTVGDPGNAADTTGVGAVAYDYRISKHEVTNAQYAEFLNAAASTDPLALYSTRMNFGGITRSGSSGSFTYSANAGHEDKPVVWISFYNSLRFANWLQNGQGTGDTETGAYTLLGGTAIPSNGLTVTRNAGATIFLPTDDEWYKAAYFNGTRYFAYPAGFDAKTTCASPGAAANTANCGFILNGPTDVGSYTGSASPYGTFDQGGNAWEWNETIFVIGAQVDRGRRGGTFENDPILLAAYGGGSWFPADERYDVGFRVASLPEPGTTLCAMAGMLALAGWRCKLH